MSHTHTWIVLVSEHGPDAPYGCQTCPERATGAEIDAARRAAFNPWMAAMVAPDSRCTDRQQFDMMTRCITHACVFPAGWEDAHRAGGLGEQNAAGACVFEPDDAS
jgi:hypothetical protein